MPTAEKRAADPILVVENIVKRFETQDGVLTAVDDVSFNVMPGEFLSVIGPSGCGKSTLFNVMGGLLDGYEGRVSVGGETVRGPHASIGMIFQEESTFPWRTVIDNVAFPLEIAGMAKAERIERGRHFINLVGLNGFERRYPARSEEHTSELQSHSDLVCRLLLEKKKKKKNRIHKKKKKKKKTKKQQNKTNK